MCHSSNLKQPRINKVGETKSSQSVSARSSDLLGQFARRPAEFAHVRHGQVCRYCACRNMAICTIVSISHDSRRWPSSRNDSKSSTREISVEVTPPNRVLVLKQAFGFLDRMTMSQELINETNQGALFLLELLFRQTK